MKLCVKCHKNTALKSWCKPCQSKAVQKWKKQNPLKVSIMQRLERKLNPERFRLTRRKSTLKKYGLTMEQFDEMLKNQQYQCSICKTQTPGGFANQWALDHDHNTGRIRGILCNNCNKGLGHFKDSIQSLKTAIVYLGEIV